MTQSDYLLVVEAEAYPCRLDVFITDRLPHLSRSQAAALILAGHIVVDGCPRKAGYKLKIGETVAVHLPEPVAVDLQAEAIPLDILYEDDDLLVLNKPAGIVVHPAAGHWSGTLVNALLYHCPEVMHIGGERRPGIVHRLDKDTSGVLVVAKTDQAQVALCRQFKERLIDKQYLAIVAGWVEPTSGTIDFSIGRHPQDRKKMSITSRHGRTALTLWRVTERFEWATLLEVDLKTGRTHQIRVHCAAIGHPIIGDIVYGRQRINLPGNTRIELQNLLRSVRRHLLHAARLTLFHPITGQSLTFEAALPPDMQGFIDRARELTFPD